jgi:hypothetical protein
VDYDFAQVQVANPAHPDQQAPRLHAAYWPTRGLKAGAPVTFLVRSFRVPADQVDEFWDFGDGSPVQHTRSHANVHNSVAEKHDKEGYATIQHSFAKPGRYLVCVRRGNARGETATAHLEVLIEAR